MSYDPPPPDAGSDTGGALRRHTRQIAAAVRQAMQGKLNAVGTFTCTAGVGSTVLTDSRLTSESAVLWDATTANAAAEFAAGTMYVLTANRNNGAWTVTHANAATANRTFRYVIIG